jgi:hypothetical protein
MDRPGSQTPGRRIRRSHSSKAGAVQTGDRLFVSLGCEPHEGDLAMVVSDSVLTDAGVVIGRSEGQLQIDGSDATSKQFSLATHQAAKILAVIFA